MAITKLHEIHTRRRSRNVGLGVVLGAFVVLVMLLTMVKLTMTGGVAAGVGPAQQGATVTQEASQ